MGVAVGVSVAGFAIIVCFALAAVACILRRRIALDRAKEAQEAALLDAQHAKGNGNGRGWPLAGGVHARGNGGPRHGPKNGGGAGAGADAVTAGDVVVLLEGAEGAPPGEAGEPGTPPRPGAAPGEPSGSPSWGGRDRQGEASGSGRAEAGASSPSGGRRLAPPPRAVLSTPPPSPPPQFDGAGSQEIPKKTLARDAAAALLPSASSPARMSEMSRREAILAEAPEEAERAGGSAGAGPSGAQLTPRGTGRVTPRGTREAAPAQPVGSRFEPPMNRRSALLAQAAQEVERKAPAPKGYAVDKISFVRSQPLLDSWGARKGDGGWGWGGMLGPDGKWRG